MAGEDALNMESPILKSPTAQRWFRSRDAELPEKCRRGSATVLMGGLKSGDSAA
jgi:hypothetical protein